MVQIVPLLLFLLLAAFALYYVYTDNRRD